MLVLYQNENECKKTWLHLNGFELAMLDFHKNIYKEVDILFQWIVAYGNISPFMRHPMINETL